ncbi:MAG: hypothetical protein SNF33_07680 [Candidatus Algichlamydia australiensis]|nr:hypothetical protein [Chlamydiales bacterium]
MPQVDPNHLNPQSLREVPQNPDVSKNDPILLLMKASISLAASVFTYKKTKSYTYTALTFFLVYLFLDNFSRISIAIRPIFSFDLGGGHRRYPSNRYSHTPYRHISSQTSFGGGAPPATNTYRTTGLRAGAGASLGRPPQQTSYFGSGAPPATTTYRTTGLRAGAGASLGRPPQQTSYFGSGAPPATTSWSTSGRRPT